jgi:hypothetical protein
MSGDSLRARVPITVDGEWFKDEQGRTLLLRGVNLGGSSKVPFRPDGATHLREGFFQHRQVSFVGRPFPLDEADEHFRRLRRWGLTFLRLLVTWEAIEHEGPGIYDREYLDYLYEVVRRAGEHGFLLFIDPHQDVWSRFSGGDGAPGWTLEAAGLDMAGFAPTGAAIVHATHGDPFPRMIWPTNEAKLAAATMFSLFFGGDDFAPQTSVDGQPIQGYLQGHYLAAMQQVARRLRGLPQVVGYDSLNEPSAGYIGWPDLGRHAGLLRQGDTPTPFQSMLLGAGYAQEIEVWRTGLGGVRRTRRRWIDPAGARAWRPGRDCLWRENGVWDLDGQGQPRLLRPRHFCEVQGRPVQFDDYLLPFWRRCASAIRAVDPESILFLEAPPGQPPPAWGLGTAPRVVHAAHWYDGLTVFFKRLVPFLGVDFRTGKLAWGPRGVDRSFAAQLAKVRAEASERMAGVPTLIGEFGIPFDLDHGRAYRTGSFRRQVRAMDRSFRPLEANLLSGTLWNYTADNDNRRGDQWNGEDFSVFSLDRQDGAAGPDSGGRALEAVVRPYARAVAGLPLKMSYDIRRRAFELIFRHDPAVQAPTEIYVPSLHYPRGYRAEVSDGEFEVRDVEQVLLYRHGTARLEHWLRLRPATD